MKRIVVACMILLATTGVSRAETGCASLAPPSGSQATIGFTSIPSNVAADRSPVELRVGLRNETTTTRTFTVDFYVDVVDASHRVNAAPLSMTLAPNQGGMATVWWTAVPGAHELLHIVKQGGSVIRQGSAPIEILPSLTRAAPRFGAGWIELGHVMANPRPTEQQIRARIDEMHAIGMDTIIIAYVEYGGTFYPSNIPELGGRHTPIDVVGAILDQACVNGMRVMLGLGRGPKGPLNFDGPDYATPEEIEEAADLGEQVAAELWSLYRRYHDTSFYGWYLTHEANDYDHAKVYYDEMGRRLDRFGMEKPVLVAPSGTPFGINPEMLNASTVDIYAYQDAVGAGYVGPDRTCIACAPYTYSYDPYNRIPDLDAIFAKYASWHEGTDKHIWSDTEIWEMHGPQYASAYAAQCARVRDQIAPVSKHVEMISGYEFFGYMRAPANDTAMPQRDAAALWDGYEAFASGETSTICPGQEGRRTILDRMGLLPALP